MTIAPSEWYDSETKRKEQNAFWRRVSVHCSDIEQAQPYPQCLDYVASRLDAARNLTKEKGTTGEETPRTEPTGLGDWC